MVTDVNNTTLPIQSFKSGVIRHKKKQQKKCDLSYDDTVKPASKLDFLKRSPKKVLTAECYMTYPENSSKLFFHVPDEKYFKTTGIVRYKTIECVNITAADFKVSCKYGSWDSMVCRLLIECKDPLITMTPLQNKNENETGKQDDLSEEKAAFNAIEVTAGWTPLEIPTETLYYAEKQESCMVKATIDVAHVSAIKDILHKLKFTQSKERKILLKKHKEGVDKHIPAPPKIREGLPEWVNYVPAQWYSSTTRKVLEYILIIYTVLTLAWAVWQLYKHVGFIRNYLKPIMDLIEFYFAVIKAWFRWLDSLFDVLTDYWWKVMKPMYVLIAPLYITLSQLFKPLRNITGMITMVFQPVLDFFTKTSFIFKPLTSFVNTLSKPLFSLFGFFAYCAHSLWEVILMLWAALSNTSVVKVLFDKVSQLGITRIVNEILHGSLDPLKAQMLVIRDILIRSFKQIFYGLRFIITRIQATLMFVKQEREYAKEESDIKSNKDNDVVEPIVNDKIKEE